MFRPLALALAGLVVLALPLQAQPVRIEALTDALRLPEVIEIMHEEGVDYGEEIGETLLGGRGGAQWSERVRDIYARDRMAELFARRFETELEGRPEVVESIIDFAGSERGARVIGLEISARRVLLDDDVDAAARRQLEQMRDADSQRLEQLGRFVRINDLVDENVVGALNATYAFYMGLVESGAPGFDMGEQEVLSDVWSQEADIRADLEEWLFSFLALAYRPLSDDELEAYIAFSATDAGQALNAALFAGFNAMFETISRDLGRAAGNVLASQDL